MLERDTGRIKITILLCFFCYCCGEFKSRQRSLKFRLSLKENSVHTSGFQVAQIFFCETDAAPHCYAMSFAAVYSEVVCFLELFNNHTAKKIALHEVGDEQACSASFNKLLQPSPASFFSKFLFQYPLKTVNTVLRVTVLLKAC